MSKQNLLILPYCIFDPRERYDKGEGIEGYTKEKFGEFLDFTKGKYIPFFYACPECRIIGENRDFSSKDQFEVHREKFRALAEAYFEDFQKIKDKTEFYIIGMKKSPSCGIYYTTTGEGKHNYNISEGRGIFMEELLALFEKNNIPIKTAEIQLKTFDKYDLERQLTS
jgi:predicted secreted protein